MRELPSFGVDRVSVVICTWNRCELLRRTLEGMTRLKIPAGIQWELLVVNNNCSDSTDEVIEAFVRHIPIRRLFEEKQGLANARNRAIRAVTGNLIIWTDDDVLVDPEWIVEYLSAVQDHPEAMFFGGTVDPWFDVEPPGWIRRHFRELRGAYATRQFGRDVRPLQPGEQPFGANMALRKEAFSTATFDSELGRAGNNMLSGEETDLFARLRKAHDHPGVWVGTAVVKHFVPKERLTSKYLRSFWCGLGRTQVRRDGLPTGSYLWRAPRWAWRKYWESVLATWLFGPFKGSRWIHAFRDAAYHRGVILESRIARPRQAP